MNERLPRLLETYLKHLSIKGCTQATIKHKAKEIGLFVRFLEAQGHSMLAQEVSPFDVLAHLEDMKQRQLSPTTVNTRYRAIAAWFAWALEWEIVPTDPTQRIKPPTIPRIRKPFLKPEAFDALLALCPLNTLTGARRQSMLWIFLTTGMRRRELQLLEVDDLDWTKGTILVVHGKGQKDRQVHFHREAQKATLRYLQHRHDQLSCLWVTEEGGPLSYDGVGKDFSRLFERAGVKDQVKDGCHIFRRTWAANAVRQGIPRQYTQALAGWSTPTMMDKYVAWMGAEEEQAIEAFRDFDPFGGQRKRKGRG